MILPRTQSFSVSDVNKYIKGILSNDENLKFLCVKGEISNFKQAGNGHYYFSLKDNDSSIGAVMFSTYASKLTFEPKNGDEVLVLASIDVYVPRGNYQLMVYEIDQVGLGNMLLELEQLKQKLQKEGLFDEKRKRSINLFPRAVGVITAPNGAAIHDIVTNLHRRYPICDIYVFPSSVQGENAPKELLKAFNKSQEYDLTTLIIGRGGGASEDLSAFNDETLVRAIANSKMPVISAVGHEVDVTLVDFVADKRASTPTGAAELASVDRREIEQSLSYKFDDMANILKENIQDLKNDINNYKNDIEKSLYNSVALNKSRLEGVKQHLNALNPTAILNRGYSITTDQNGNVISSVKSLNNDAILLTKLKDGQIESKILSKKEN
ncbi:MAG: exodeoxyribonuclease VII large subunit [Bacilli bacterium]|nr:exodeoxyribonuclease VII large subunit [Bacilli bacterium]